MKSYLLQSDFAIQGIGYLVGILIAIGLFFALRNLALWYWKIDTLIQLQSMQIKELQDVNSKLTKIVESISDKK